MLNYFRFQLFVIFQFYQSLGASETFLGLADSLLGRLGLKKWLELF